jgi:beta-galactosidase/beta-glucuronidase
MKKIFLLTFSLFLVIQMQAQLSFGESARINSLWKFSNNANHEAINKNFNDHRWQTVSLPHDWSIRGQHSPTLASATGYLPGGIGWYRKTINIPADRSGKNVYLYFEGVYNRSEVYLNGQLLGKRPNGYISFAYEATPHIKFGQENVITVRVDHSQSADSRWYTGSGIYRDVYLVYANPVHISQWGVYVHPEVSDTKSGILNVSVDITNSTAKTANVVIENELISPAGKVAGKSKTSIKTTAGKETNATSKIKIKNPELWSLDKPALYTLKTKVYQNGKLIDQSTTRTGFRTYTFDPNKGFALNGEWMKVKGVCLHHDAGVLGAASYKEVWKRRLLTLKELGCNAIRTSHNPQASHLYEICDEIGLLVMNEAFDEWEFPKTQMARRWNVGTPGFQGTFDFFEEWGERDLADMVRRDRNHISIFAWSIGNEVDYPTIRIRTLYLPEEKKPDLPSPFLADIKKMP